MSQCNLIKPLKRQIKKDKIWYGGLCKFCNRTNQPYMIDFKLWKELEFGKGFVCLYCVEEKLGRKLQVKDFIDAPINKGCFGFYAELWVDRIYQTSFGTESKKCL